MSIVLAAGLFAALTAAEPILSLDHRAIVEHDGGSVEATYRTHVSLSKRQIGSVGKIGGMSSLRCEWRANITVHREARHASGALLSRRIADDGAVTASRPGWCEKHNLSVTREIAAREDQLRAHAMRLAQADEAELRAELAGLRTAG